MNKKGKLKKSSLALILAVSVGLSAVGLTACGQTTKPPIDDDKKNEQINPTPTPGPDDPIVIEPEDPTKEEEERKAQVLKEASENAVSYFESLGTNFTYQIVNNDGSDSYEFKVDGKKVRTTYKKVETFYDISGETGYKFSYSNEDKVWYRESEKDANLNSMISEVVNPYMSIVWTEYDESAKVLSAKVGGDNYMLQISNKGAQLRIEGDVNRRASFNEKGKTTVTLPTKYTDKNPEIVDKGNVIYEKGAYNIPLLTSTVENWIKKTDYLTKVSLTGAKTELKDVIYSNTLDGGVKFGFIYTLNGNTNFRQYALSQSAETKFLGQKEKTDTVFMNVLASVENPIVTDGVFTKVEYSTFENNAPAEFTTMTNNILKEVVETGYRGSDVSNAGTKISEYANAKVLGGFKGFADGGYAGGGIGNKKEIPFFLLLERQDGNVEAVNFAVASSIDGVSNENINIINNNKNKWFVVSANSYNIDAENTLSYSNTRTASVSYNIGTERYINTKSLEL